MGQLVFQANSGGQTNLVGQNTASTFNLNIPLANGTLVSTGDTGTVTNTMLAGSITNAKLVNSSVTIGSTSVALGATSTTLDGVNIGATTPGTGAFTTFSASSTTTLSGGTANGVAYLNGSKVLTTGSALTFDGSTLTQTANSSALLLAGGSSAAQGGYLGISRGGTNKIYIGTASNVIGGGSNTSDDLALFATADTRFYSTSSEQMRLTSTGLGIGTSSPSYKLDVTSSNGYLARFKATGNYSGVLADTGTTTGGGYFGAAQNGTRYASFGTSGAFLGDSSIDASISSESSGGNIRFYTNGSSIEKMRLDSSGNLGIGTTANASAILDAQSTTKGVRFPNMTTTQKNAISSPAAGLVVFDTTLSKLCVYSGSAWQTITSI